VVLCDDNKLFGMEVIGRGNAAAHRRRNSVAKQARHACHVVDLGQQKERVNTGRTSVLFASLIAQFLSPGSKPKATLGTQCQRALAIAYDWTKTSSGPGGQPSHANLLVDIGSMGLQPTGPQSPPQPAGTGALRAPRYDELWREWIDSSRNIGTIGNTLQLWRAEGFEDVRGDCIFASNVPHVERSAELRRHVLVPPDWLTPAWRTRAEATRTLVKVERRAPGQED
jgi:hypothetical protein